jgi:hypothetical protein
MEHSGNKTETETLRQKAEALMKMKPSISGGDAGSGIYKKRGLQSGALFFYWK